MSYGYPHQPPHGAPPQQGFYPSQHGGPPPHAGYGAPPPPPPAQQHGYGAPPPQQHHQQAPPSLGYARGQFANVDTSNDAQALRKAMKGFGTDDTSLINALLRIPDPLIMENLKQTFQRMFSRDLMSDVKSETSGYYEDALLALLRGPLMQDVYNLHDALDGMGTNEHMLDDVLLGRSNADIAAIKQAYYETHRKSLEQMVRDDLSMKTEKLFDMVLAAQRQDESAPVYPQDLDGSVSAIHQATHGFNVDQVTVCHVLSSHSDGQIRAISQEFQNRYRESLHDRIKSKFQGHMEHSLLRMLRCGEDRAMADAELLEEAMAGPGTKDKLLVNRVVRLKWNPAHRQQVKGAYRHRYKRDLVKRVEDEVSGNYKKLMVAILNAP